MTDKVKAGELQAWLAKQLRKREPRVRRRVRLTGMGPDALARAGYVPAHWPGQGHLSIGKVLARISPTSSLLEHVLQDALDRAWVPDWAAGLLDGRVGPREREALVRRLVASRELRKAIASTYRVGGQGAATTALQSDLTR